MNYLQKQRITAVHNHHKRKIDGENPAKYNRKTHAFADKMQDRKIGKSHGCKIF